MILDWQVFQTGYQEYSTMFINKPYVSHQYMRRLLMQTMRTADDRVWVGLLGALCAFVDYQETGECNVNSWESFRLDVY